MTHCLQLCTTYNTRKTMRLIHEFFWLNKKHLLKNSSFLRHLCFYCHLCVFCFHFVGDFRREVITPVLGKNSLSFHGYYKCFNN